jgi:phospholipase C
MKFAFRGLLCLIALAAACAHAQTIQQGTFKHIIFVIQENRTPDNLFGSGPSSNQCVRARRRHRERRLRLCPSAQRSASAAAYLQHVFAAKRVGRKPAKPKVIDPDHGYIGWGLDFGGGNQNGFCHEYSSYSIYGSTCPS